MLQQPPRDFSRSFDPFRVTGCTRLSRRPDGPNLIKQRTNIFHAEMGNGLLDLFHDSDPNDWIKLPS
jgi:hypothetical protein